MKAFYPPSRLAIYVVTTKKSWWFHLLVFMHVDNLFSVRTQEKILANVDKNGDNAIDYEEFLDLVRGENSGFGRRQRQAFRQLLKQTIEFIVPYKYSYQNQYSCNPPPVFLLTISLLQVVVYTYNVIMYHQGSQFKRVTRAAQ